MMSMLVEGGSLWQIFRLIRCPQASPVKFRLAEFVCPTRQMEDPDPGTVELDSNFNNGMAQVQYDQSVDYSKLIEHFCTYPWALHVDGHQDIVDQLGYEYFCLPASADR